MEIKFPRDDDDPNLVTIMGAPENVEECKDHLLNLSEEYMQDITEREDMDMYMSQNSTASTSLLSSTVAAATGSAPPQSAGDTPQKKEVGLLCFFCSTLLFYEAILVNDQVVHIMSSVAACNDILSRFLHEGQVMVSTYKGILLVLVKPSCLGEYYLFCSVF